MPRGPKLASDNHSPISSLASAVLSDESSEALRIAGLSSFEIAKIRSEADALAVLALRGDDNPTAYAPGCFQREYSPERSLCSGCVFSAKCWTGDARYLRAVKAGTAKRPPAPKQIVDEVLATIKRQPPKPRKRQPPKPRVRR